MQSAATKTVWLTFPLSGEAYGKLSSIDAALTHSYDPATEKVLCGKVKAKSILDDELWGGEGCTERAPTCPHCLKRLAKLAASK